MQRKPIPEDDRPDIIVDTAAPVTPSTEYRRVALATMVGTTVEWYDFFIYAHAAGLLLATCF